MRDGFILHEKTMAQIAKLTDEQAGELLKAMISHYNGEERGDVSQIVDVLMVDVEERMDADQKAYTDSVEQRKAAAEKRWGKVQNDADGMREDAKDMREDADGMREECEDDTKNAVSVSDSVSVKPKKKKNMSGKPDNPPLMPAVRQIVDHLNEKAGTKYLASSRATVDLIKARLSERWTVEDHIKVIDNMVAAWKGDPKMQDYLRPSTLFARAHFEEYLNKKPTARSGTPGRFQNLENRTDQTHKDMVAQLIAMQTGG